MGRDRVVAGSVLAVASAAMLWPLLLSWSGAADIPLVETLGFAPGERAPAVAWTAGVVFAAAYVAFTFWAFPSVLRQQRELSAFKLVGVVAALASGIMEEVVFRRWLMDSAAGWGVGAFGQVALSAVVFGAAHLTWHAFNFDWRFSLPAAAATTAAGAALAAIYLLAGRNLGPCILAHVLINLIIEPWLVLAAISHRRARPGP